MPTEDVINLYQEGGWWQESELSRAAIPAMIEGSFCFMAVFDGEKLIGMGRVISDGASDGYIQDVVIKKEYRGSGVGGELVRLLTKFCVEKKLDWIGLVAEPNTCQFYEKYGYRVKKGYQLMVLQDGNLDG